MIFLISNVKEWAEIIYIGAHLVLKFFFNISVQFEIHYLSMVCEFSGTFSYANFSLLILLRFIQKYLQRFYFGGKNSGNNHSLN